jgi:SAM-dependent methyltransferase
MTLSDKARSQAKAEAQAAIDSASFDYGRGVISEAEWQRRVARALAKAYLLDDDPRWQSGFDGDPDLWRQARELILDAVPGDGTFLDIGCATGHLIECLATWARERRLHLSTFGLELDPDLASAARRRLPAWADRIFIGSASDWDPPWRFTYVRTGLEYVPAGRESFLVERLLRDVVEPGGRLIVGPVSERDLDEILAAFKDAGFPKAGVLGASDRNGKTRHVVWADQEDWRIGNR